MTVRTVGELKKILSSLPDDLYIILLADGYTPLDGINHHCVVSNKILQNLTYIVFSDTNIKKDDPNYTPVVLLYGPK